MTVSLRLNNSDSELIKAYAEMNGISVSELFRQMCRMQNKSPDTFLFRGAEKRQERFQSG